MNRFARAAAAGLVVGLVVASLGMAFKGVMTLREGCAAPATDECVFQDEMSQSVGRTQLLAGVGCGFLAAGIGLLLKKKSGP